MSTPALRLEAVSKTFFPGTVNERTALREISLTMETGEFVTIIGSNGAGKSTLFNAICGAFSVDSGRILLEGGDITHMRDYKRAYSIGRLFQDPMRGTAPNMTVEENLSLAFGRKAHKSFFAVNRHDSKIFREQLSQLGLGLEDRMGVKIGLLSGGQRQAVALLMCTISRPNLLLLDEHTAALDPATAQKVLEITEKLVEHTPTATMMITHDIGAALALGTRTIMMDEGRVILDLSGERRKNMTVEELLKLYSQESKKALLSDRMLFELGRGQEKGN